MADTDQALNPSTDKDIPETTSTLASTTLPLQERQLRFKPRPTYPKVATSHPGSENVAVESSDELIIHFRHPGYPNTKLISLNASDGPQGGIQHAFARTVCGLIADCKWNGHLSRDREGKRPVLDEDEVLLRDREYFYILENDPTLEYPIILSFDDFRFPHQNLPPYWLQGCLRIQRKVVQTRDPSPRRVVTARDVSCRVTSYIEGTQACHIVPAKESEWFWSNQMGDYISHQSEGLDDQRNLILLRADLHLTFDRRSWVIVPKDGVWVVHVLDPLYTREMIRHYHNVILHDLAEIPPEFLLARLAWTLFGNNNYEQFLNKLKSRKVAVIDKQNDSQSVVKHYTIQSWRQERLKSRSRSPTKRHREDNTEEHAELNVGCGSDGWEAEEKNPDWVNVMDGEESRGRSRKRIFDFEPQHELDQESDSADGQSFSSNCTAPSWDSKKRRLEVGKIGAAS